MRKLLAMVIAIVLVVSGLPLGNVYADSIGKEASACKELGILIGADSTGVTPAYLATAPTRIQAFIIFLRLKGLYNEATSFQSDKNFSDASTAGWASNYMAYAKNKPELGWVGYPDGTFAPGKQLDGKAFYKVMLETLGYKQDIDFIYDDSLKFAQQLGIIANASEIAAIKSFTVNDVAKGIYNTLNTKPKGSDKKLISVMVENQIITAERAVAAGFTLDIKEVKVVGFNNVANNKLELEFDKDINLQKGDIEISQIDKDSRLSILSVNSNKNKATVITTEGTPFAAYEITINTLVPENGMAIRGYKNKYVALPRDTVKPTVTVKPVPISSYEISISFSEEMDRNDAENLSNYYVERDVMVLSAQLSDDGKTVVLRTTEQYPDNFYKITIQNIGDIAGNKMDKYSNYFDGLPRDVQAPVISDVQSENNRTIAVTFNERVDSNSVENVNNYSVDNNLIITSAALDNSGKVVRLSTSEQALGVFYKLTVRNIADTSGNIMASKEFRFTGDSSKPTASVIAMSNNEVMVSFNEKVDKASAEDPNNYSLNNNLQITRAVLDSSGKTVSLITSSQTVHQLYTIIIVGVKDLWGNSINTCTATFGGMPVNNSDLTFTAVGKANQVVVTFNKRVDKATAENVFNYTFDNGLGYTAKATLDTSDTGRIVTLLTDNQTAGKLYSLTVSNVTDISGNAISSDEKNSKKKFVGVSSSSNSSISSGSLKLDSIVIVDTNTFDLVFSGEISSSELDRLKVAVSTASSFSSSLPSSMDYIKYFIGDKKVVRVQFKTSSSNNPDIFTSGYIYEATVTGIDRLVVNDNSNIKQFAGTNLTNVAPSVESVTALNSTAIEVKFSEPVKNISASQFSINGVSISSVSVSTTDIVDKVILFLSNSSPLKDGITYKLTVKSGIKDAAGFSSVVINGSTSTSSNNYIEFDGTSVLNDSPLLASDVSVIDQYTLKLEFTEPIRNYGTSSFSVRKTSGGSSSQYIVSKVVPSDDKTQFTVYYNSRYNGFSSDSEYELTLSSSLVDLQGMQIDSGNRKVTFVGVDNPPEALEIVATSVSADNKEITLVANRDLDNTGLSMDYFIFTGANYYRTSYDSVECSNGVITIYLRNALSSKDVLTIEITSNGRTAITDMNKQKLTTEQVKVNTN